MKSRRQAYYGGEEQKKKDEKKAAYEKQLKTALSVPLTPLVLSLTPVRRLEEARDGKSAKDDRL